MSALDSIAAATSGNGGSLAPPHSLEAEQSVLGAILLSDRALYALVIEEGLKPDDFYRERHSLVYGAMLSLYNESEPIDVLTVTEHLRSRGQLDQAGGQSAIDSLAASVPAAGNARHYARIVREHALVRRLLTTTYEIQARVQQQTAAPRELVEQAERAMLEVAHDDRQKDFRSIEEVLDEELDKLHRLSLEGTALTGTPSGFKDLDELTGGFQPGNLVIIAARPSMGKCLHAQSLVYDPMTGGRKPIKDLLEAHEAGREVWVAATTPDLSVVPAKVSAVARSGIHPLFHVRTKLGRRVKATANHPFLTLDGWAELRALAPGSRVAVPRYLPWRGEPQSMPDHEIVLLAALIADGGLTQTTPRFVAAEGSALIPLVEQATLAAGGRWAARLRGTNWHVNLCQPQRGVPNPITALCERHGPMGKSSAEKYVPDAIFSLDEQQIARFLGVLYACDGHVYASGHIRQIGYSTISERLARDVQHLLLRLGIIAKIRKLRRTVYEGTEKQALEVRITDPRSVGAFCELVPVPGKTERQVEALAGLKERNGTNADTVPVAVWDRVLAAKGAQPWGDVSEACGHPRNHNWHVGTRGVSREQLARLATALDDEPLDHLATSDLWWDEIESIEAIGEEETYDLEVPLHHNFVADDIVVHNSALVCNIAENAAIEHNAPVALFSLEMSETELAQRFVASQARIKGEELRKGRVAESKWPKIMEASQRLARAPLYIDDSSDVGMLEIRAKARRLHQQHGLGLIIVDYLQLLRADARVENRVEAIGQMSRGLKILARELETPVIALSQLNRSVESRTDKRPVLSDLRESGCLAGDTLVPLADTGERVPIRGLVGRTDLTVTALNTETWKLETRAVTNAFSTGIKPVFQLTLRSGRTIRATSNHKFRTLGGWRRLDELGPKDRLATPRRVPTRPAPTMIEDELRLLGPSTLYRSAMRRERAGRVAETVNDDHLRRLATSDVYWDEIIAIQPDGVEEVFDLTVEGLHNFVAGDIVVHNSIEQDADLVAFIYRDEYYDRESEREGEADIIIAKHRNGAIGDVILTFQKEYPKFLNYAGERFQ